MEDSKCPKCWEPVHPCHYDSHIKDCGNFIKYGIIVKFTAELLKCLFSEEIMNEVETFWNLDFGKTISQIALLNIGIPLKNQDKVKFELDHRLESDMYIVKIRSNEKLNGLKVIQEGGEYPSIVFSRNLMGQSVFNKRLI